MKKRFPPAEKLSFNDEDASLIGKADPLWQVRHALWMEGHWAEKQE